jgi:hypothetical protein
MKRCPQCLEAYGDDEKFCEMDGQKLSVDPTFHEASPSVAPTRNPTERSLMVLVGVFGGVVMSAALFVVYSVARNDPAESPQQTARVLQASPSTRSSAPSTTAPVVRPTATPLEEEESAESEPEAETKDEAHTDPIPTKVNQGPISTSRLKDESNVKTVIQLHDGTSIDVDAAWKEGQGIWYRRGGLVSFLDSKDVKSISTAADAKKSDTSAGEGSH